MNKIRCLIVDDEPLAISLLKGYVEKTPYLELVGSSKSAIEAMAFLEEQPVDLIFLDIQMPNLTGMQLAKTLKDGPKIIFTTAYEQYALEGYKVEAVDYLLKPFSFEEFLQAAQKSRKYFEPKFLGQDSVQEVELSNPDFIIVKSDYKLKQIELKDILYIEGLKDYVKIHCASMDKPILSLLSMKSMEANLPKNFMRVHRSFIVNLNRMDLIERGIIIFGDVYIPVSDKYKEKFNQFISNRFLE